MTQQCRQAISDRLEAKLRQLADGDDDHWRQTVMDRCLPQLLDLAEHAPGRRAECAAPVRSILAEHCAPQTDSHLPALSEPALEELVDFAAEQVLAIHETLDPQATSADGASAWFG